MDLPPIDKELLAKMGVSTNAVPLRPAFDFGINIPDKLATPPTAISPEEAKKLFGVSLSVKMNFVPLMLIALAMDYASQFVNYCRDNRISEFKKHNRLIKACIEDYIARLAKSYGAAFEKYTECAERYFIYVDADRFRMWCSIGNIAHRQSPPGRGHTLITLVAIIHKLIDYADDYDRKMDKVIASRMNAPVCRKQDDAVKIIRAMCIEFEETWGLGLKPDPMTDISIGVLANRAHMLADIIIEEENVSKS